jgi:subfamily B ATP-binding cassette protein MsbA
MLIDGLLQAGVINYLKALIDRLMADPASFVRETLPRMAIIGILAALVFFPVAYCGHLACSVLSSRMVTTFRMALYRHLQCLSISFFNRKQSGEIATRLTQDVDNGVQIMVGFITGAAWALGLLVTAMVSMFFLSWKLTLLFCRP